MFDKITEISLLYDFYSNLLTQKQRDVMDLYHGENYSLSEISEEFGISRQAVHISLKNAEKSLLEYEKKLGLVKRFDQSRTALAKIDEKLDAMIGEHNCDVSIAKKLADIKSIIDGLDI